MAEIQMARYEDFAEASKTVFVDINHPTKRDEKVRVEVQSLPPADLFAITGAALTRRMRQDAPDKDVNNDKERTAFLQSLDDESQQEMYEEDSATKKREQMICKMVVSLRLSTLPSSECPYGVVSVSQISESDQWAMFNACINLSVVSAEDRFPSDIAESADESGSSGVSASPSDGKREQQISK